MPLESGLLHDIAVVTFACAHGEWSVIGLALDAEVLAENGMLDKLVAAGGSMAERRAESQVSGSERGTDRIDMKSGTISSGAIVMGTWNTGSLLGGLRAAGSRQTSKRAYLDALLADVDAHAHQEVRGCASDLSVLPDSHQYFGTCLTTASPGTSSGGGTVLAVRKHLLVRSTDVRVRTVAQGRIVVVSVLAGRWGHFAAIHADPSQPMSGRRRDLGRVASLLDGLEGISYLLGD